MAFDGEIGGVVDVVDGKEADAIVRCIAEANRSLPPNTVFEVRGRISIPDGGSVAVKDMSIDRSQIAWYHLPDMADPEGDIFSLNLDGAELDALGGFFRVLRARTAPDIRSLGPNLT